VTSYKAQVEKDEDGRWSAWIEDLPGCAAWGYTQAEALDALRDAAEAYIEDMIAAGEEAPNKHVVVLEKPVTSG
jgi:predicted RNase H-like HicB family nuclease